ncbi:hypothetical protein [Streptomyces sp. 4F14]|uniref:hypothetical protein n=1 Tax=Streptomyces sp. 4F14 TaxID=3394380 RepID=UPI003A8573D5
MSNSSYLCVSDRPVLYPSSQDPDFVPRTGVVATDAQAVPLLWLALFRAGDLVTKVFTFDEDDDDDEVDEDDVIEATAPLAPKDRALAQLAAALPALARLFPGAPDLAGHAALLREAVERAPGAYVTVELDEIAGLWEGEEEGSFVPALTAALEGFEGVEGGAGVADPASGHNAEAVDPASGAGVGAVGEGGAVGAGEASPASGGRAGRAASSPTPARTALLGLTRLDPAHPFPPARLLLDALEAGDGDYWNFTRLLGTAFAAEVPWEAPRRSGDVTPASAGSAP